MLPRVILVAGASSGPGQLAVRELIAREIPTRVLVRSEDQATRFRTAGAEAVVGDVTDEASLVRACSGVQTVASLVGRHFARSKEHLWEIDALGNERLIRVAERAQVRRFVLLSALWADRSLAPYLMGAKRHAEHALQASSMSSAILRPSTFTTGASSLVGAVGPSTERWGLAFVPAPDSRPISFITLEDVAACVVEAAVSEVSGAFELGGPEAITLGEGARRIGALLAKRVRVVPLPAWVTGATKRFAERRGFGGYEAMLFFEMLRDEGYHCDPSAARRLLGREPTSVDVALRQYYATTRRTPWSESNLGVLRSHSR